jgi:hypothetical protein
MRRYYVIAARRTAARLGVIVQVIDYNVFYACNIFRQPTGGTKPCGLAGSGRK